jgi:hypothetical protein
LKISYDILIYLTILYCRCLRPKILAVIGGIVAVAIGIGVALSVASEAQKIDDIDVISPDSVPQDELPVTGTEFPPEETGGINGLSSGESVNLEESNQSSTRSNGSEEIVIYQVHTEPSEQAFSILVPEGWSASSGVGLSADSTVQTVFQASSPDGQSTIGFQRPRPFSYLAPVGVYTQEGQIAFAGSMLVYNYRTAEVYVPDILIPELQRLYPDIQLVKETLIPAEQGFSAGFFEFAYSNDGTNYTMQAVVTTYGAPVSGQLLIWDADLLAVTAPTEEFDSDYAEMAWNALGSMTANPTFVQNYIQEAGRSSAFLSQSYSDSFFSSLHSIQQSQNNLDAGFQGLSDATLGVHQVTDPNGTTYTVPNSHNSWYVGLSTGHFYGSNTGQPIVQEDLVPLQ